MGVGRSVAALYRQYKKCPENTTPTRSLDTLNRWSLRYGWPDRAATYDTALEAAKNAAAEAIMQEGLALEHNRVDKLKALGDLLWREMHEVSEDGVLHNIWMPDAKQLGRGEFAERYDLERFNGVIISEYRKTLDDIAKETGGRAARLPPQKVDMTQYDMTDWPSWALERVANGEAVHIVKAAIENAG